MGTLCILYNSKSEDTVVKSLNEETLKEVKAKLIIYRDVL